MIDDPVMDRAKAVFSSNGSGLLGQAHCCIVSVHSRRSSKLVVNEENITCMDCLGTFRLSLK